MPGLANFSNLCDLRDAVSSSDLRELQKWPLAFREEQLLHLLHTSCAIESGTFSVPGLVLPGRGTAWHKSGTSREIRGGWEPGTCPLIHPNCFSLRVRARVMLR